MPASAGVVALRAIGVNQGWGKSYSSDRSLRFQLLDLVAGAGAVAPGHMIMRHVTLTPSAKSERLAHAPEVVTELVIRHKLHLAIVGSHAHRQRHVQRHPIVVDGRGRDNEHTTFSPAVHEVRDLLLLLS